MTGIRKFPMRFLGTVSKPLLVAIGGMALLVAAADLRAQVVPNPLQDAIASQRKQAFGNGGNLPGRSGNLTPEQFQSIFAYRALKSRTRGQVQRGVPQFIPLGTMGYSPFPQSFGGANPQQPIAQQQTARQRRIEASRATARKKRAEREAAKAKAKAKRIAAKP